jgi:hypothetical protein
MPAQESAKTAKCTAPERRLMGQQKQLLLLQHNTRNIRQNWLRASKNVLHQQPVKYHDLALCERNVQAIRSLRLYVHNFVTERL